MIKMNEIIEGWTNLLKSKFGNVEPELFELSKQRIMICNDCKLFKNNNVCDRGNMIPHEKTGEMVSGCGCVLAAKTLCKDCVCPAGKW
jgi:hypothetical protein